MPTTVMITLPTVVTTFGTAADYYANHTVLTSTHLFRRATIGSHNHPIIQRDGHRPHHPNDHAALGAMQYNQHDQPHAPTRTHTHIRTP